MSAGTTLFHCFSKSHFYNALVHVCRLDWATFSFGICWALAILLGNINLHLILFPELVTFCLLLDQSHAHGISMSDFFRSSTDLSSISWGREVETMEKLHQVMEG